MSTATITASPGGIDRDTFAAAWVENRAGIRRWLLARMHAHADDLTSETFTRAWAGRHTYRPEAGSIRNWLYSIARNTLTDFLRYCARRPATYRLGDTDLTALVGSTGRPTARAHRLESTTDPTDYAAAVVDRLRMRTALADLSPAYRQVLELRYRHDLDIAATVAITGAAVGTVKSNTHRALAALRRVLDEQGGGA